jgi:hypothetical protein
VELERGERLVEGRQLLTPLGFLGLVAAFAIIGSAGVSVPTVAFALSIVLLSFALSTWNARHLAITDRRIVEYRVLFARLARRWPRFAPHEAHSRRTFALQDLATVRRSGPNLVLRMRDGTQHEISCHQDEEAARLMAVVDDHLKRAPWMRPTRRPIAMKVTATVSTAPVEPGRCPYCHDAVAEDEAATCERCGVVQHEECMGIHGGCAAFSCQGERKKRVRG